MSLLSITRVQNCTKRVFAFRISALILISVTIAAATAQAWDIDLSRRRKAVQKKEALSSHTETPEVPAAPPILSSVLFSPTSQRDVVILNTEKGFVPATVQLKANQKYNIHVVNINEKERNVSFVMDAFSQFASTFFGQLRSFTIEPKKDGVYSYQCPETSAEGRLIIYGETPGRTLSSEEKPAEKTGEKP